MATRALCLQREDRPLDRFGGVGGVGGLELQFRRMHLRWIGKPLLPDWILQPPNAHFILAPAIGRGSSSRPGRRSVEALETLTSHVCTDEVDVEPESMEN